MNTKSAGLRFDIDTVADVEKGMPRVLEMLDRVGARATFFVNVGRAISLIDNMMDLKKTVTNLMGDKRSSGPKKIGAFRKLGAGSFFETMILNPMVGRRGRDILSRCLKAGHELALHGGRNHAAWVRSAGGWTEEKIRADILWAREEFKRLFGFLPEGFSAPGFVMPSLAATVLPGIGFKYCSGISSDPSVHGAKCLLKEIPVNVCGPGGVPIVEHMAASGKDAGTIVNFVADRFEEIHRAGSLPVIYGHPVTEGVICGPIFEQVLKNLTVKGWLITHLYGCIMER